MTGLTGYRALAVVLLAAIAGHRYVVARRPAGSDRYHARVRAAARLIPGHIGPWVGQDVQVPAQAIRVLDPNVILSRRYVNVENGLSAGLMFVHCADAHDMAGHFPLRCYPASGWTLRASRPRDWAVDGLVITGTEYEFSRESLEERRGGGSIVVANCLLRPGGKVLRDMNAMARSIGGAGSQTSGAGQIQVYLESGVPQGQRDAAFDSLVRGYLPLIHAVLADADARASAEAGLN